TDADTDPGGPVFPDPPLGVVVVEPDWTLTRRIPMPSVWSVAWAPDGTLYATSRTTPAAGGGVYEVRHGTLRLRHASGDRPAGLAVDASGTVYWSEDYGGTVRRRDATGTTTWLSGFATGDDDPTGLAFPAPGRDGGLAADAGVVVDRGASGTPDGMFLFDTTNAASETLVAGNASALVDAVDVCLTTTDVVVADNTLGDRLLVWDRAADFTPLSLAPTLTGVQGVDLDPLDGTLLAVDVGLGELHRIDPATGITTPVLTGYAASGFGNVSVDPSGLRLALSATDEVLVYARCAPADSVDCDANGIADVCDLELDPALDCDGDGVPDACALAAGAAEDCDDDGRIDSCADCPPVDVVFLVDHSTSMFDEGAALCTEIDAVLARLDTEGLAVESTILGLTTDTHVDFPCLQGSVPDRFGVTWPGTDAPASIGTDFLACPGGDQGPSESWGTATALAAAGHPWRPGALRLVVPLGDEGPWCGNPVNTPDLDAVTWAAGVATANGVVVSPLTGTGSIAAVVTEAQRLALLTGGSHAAIAAADVDLAPAILSVVEQVCADVWDCDGSGRSDACELLEGQPDCDGNGRLDACDVAAGLDPGTCDTGDTGVE
ncbi:MAG: hypothetical protein H6734_21230, partial [Alphaproteobacteria bacterium]|nr:hypothetical protein [Alphaproteobacteria bacterium]